MKLKKRQGLHQQPNVDLKRISLKKSYPRFTLNEWDEMHFSVVEKQPWMEDTVVKYLPADGEVHHVGWLKPIIGPTQVWIDGVLVTEGLDYVKMYSKKRVPSSDDSASGTGGVL